MTSCPSPVPLSWGPRGVPVPYAATWSEESAEVGTLSVRADGSGLWYRDETPADRDQHGILWARVREAPRAGRPEYGALHPVRQRQAMRYLLCQVCGGPAGRTAHGWLFLVARPAPGSGQVAADWAEGLLVTAPPVCRPCADLALRHCPHLTDPLFVRSRAPRAWGVYGDLFTPGGRLASPSVSASAGYDHLPYGHPAARWFLAAQSVLELGGCTLAASPD
jgi:hypothetical protein